MKDSSNCRNSRDIYLLYFFDRQKKCKGVKDRNLKFRRWTLQRPTLCYLLSSRKSTLRIQKSCLSHLMISLVVYYERHTALDFLYAKCGHSRYVKYMLYMYMF